MNLNTGAEGEATAEDEQDVPDTKADVEVEIKDAEGRIARAKISGESGRCRVPTFCLLTLALFQTLGSSLLDVLHRFASSFVSRG